MCTKFGSGIPNNVFTPSASNTSTIRLYTRTAMVENSLGIATFERVVFDGPQPGSLLAFQFVEDLGGVGAQLWRRPRNATRCPGKPGGYARGAHRSVRGVHGLE